jgi:Family of unknown function (DUF6599)
MGRFIIFLAALLFLGVLPVAAQGILPSSLAGWADNGVPPAAAFPERAQTAILSEYGFISFDSHSFSRGRDKLDVAVYRMKDPSGAYGLYSFLRTPDMGRADLAEHSCISRERALVLIGDLVLDARGPDLPNLQPDLKSLVASVATRAKQGLLPTLWRHVPPNYMVAGSDRYILGPQTLNQLFPVALGGWLGFSNGTEAETARYRLGERNVMLLIADFPTPQLAMQALAELQSRFNVNGSNPGASSPALFAKRSLTLLAIVAGAPTQKEADTLLSQVRSDTELTWNEPPFEATQPGIITMVIGTLIGTGILCLFTLVASLAFGGFRLLIKRALPGMVFDRNNQIQVLQLGLASKPINAEDFYSRSGPPVKVGQVDKHLPDRVALRLFH